MTAQKDANLLQIVLENIFGNAWKFTRRKANIRIEFGLKYDDNLPVFFLSDNGVGFDVAYASKLFAPFQRLHPEREFEGTGVGLATVARIIQRHNGRVWAEGAVGQGATLFFTLAVKENRF